MNLRFRTAMRAAAFGWTAGWLAVLPFQLVEAVRNVGFSASLFAEMLASSVALYTLLSLAVSCYCCCLFFLPVIWLLSPERIVAHPVAWTILNALGGFTLMGLRAHVWTAFEHDGVGTINFWIWAFFASVFFGVTGRLYVRGMKRIIPSLHSVTTGLEPR
jgi:hypothetical protein